MQLRLIEIVLPSGASDRMAEALADQTIVGRWDERLNDELILVRVLVAADKAEKVLDVLESRFSSEESFRVMLLAVEATIPRLEPVKATEEVKDDESPARISREELYADVAHGADVTRIYLVQVVLSTIVASIGLMRNDIAVIIGAMVIAPLLGANVSLALATTLGDMKLANRSLRTGLVGMITALGLSIAIGLMFTVDPSIAVIASRTRVGTGDLLLALASGTAGVLAYTTGAPAALIGVMVAVALLPPLAVAGLMIASGEFSLALGAALLVAMNLICVNLAGVVTFLIQGVRPRTWWEAERAKRLTRRAVTIWAVLLVVLVSLMFAATLVQ